MKLLLILMSVLSLPALASNDIQITVNSNSGITGVGHGQFQAITDSRLCKTSYYDEGGRRVTVPKRLFEEFEQENDLVEVPTSYQGLVCKYKLLSSEVSFHILGEAKAVRTLGIRRMNNPKDNNIDCEVIQYGPSNRKEPYLLCNKIDIYADMSGNAVVNVNLK